MKEKVKFKQAIETILYSWGGDTPSEAIWAANELLDWLEMEYNIKIELRFAEIDGERDNYISDYDRVFKELESKL